MPSAPAKKAVRKASSVKAGRAARAQSGLSAAELGIIDYFASWGEVLGVPPSVAQIYGLLFASADPLSPDEIRERLAASKGSVSPGLRFLRERALVRVVKAGSADRAERYEAKISPGLFVQAQLRGEVAPRLESGSVKIEALKSHAAGDPALAERVARLEGWNRRGRELLPLLLNLMGGG